MFLEVKPEEQAEICETLRKRLSAKFPVQYPKLLESGMKPIDADNELIKQELISEIDLLNMYCDALHVE